MSSCFMRTTWGGDDWLLRAEGHSHSNLDQLPATEHGSRTLRSPGGGSSIPGRPPHWAVFPTGVGIAGSPSSGAPSGLNPNETTLANTPPRGYATGMVGKWHLGDAPRLIRVRHG